MTKTERHVKCGFDGCREEALALSNFCWDHISDKDSYISSLIKAQASGGDLAGCNLKKIVLKKAHLEKANLTKANLSQADLSGTHFFDCKMAHADLIGANMLGCDLTHCDMKGIDLTKGSLANARLWNSVLVDANLTECNLSGADLWNANLFNVKIWHTIFTSALSITRMSFTDGARLLGNPRINESGPLSAEEAYRDLKQYFLSGGMYNDASWASFKEKTMERLVFKKKGDLHYFPSLVMNILCGYGEKPARIILAAIATISLFALAYFSFNTVERSGVPNYVLGWYDYLYYSTITFTTVGYGDFVPAPHVLPRLLAATEAFMGVFVTGLFIFTLARKYSAR